MAGQLADSKLGEHGLQSVKECSVCTQYRNRTTHELKAKVSGARRKVTAVIAAGLPMLMENTVKAKRWLSLIVILNSVFCAVKDLGEPREDFGLHARRCYNQQLRS